MCWVLWFLKLIALTINTELYKDSVKTHSRDSIHKTIITSDGKFINPYTSPSLNHDDSYWLFKDVGGKFVMINTIKYSLENKIL